MLIKMSNEVEIIDGILLFGTENFPEENFLSALFPNFSRSRIANLAVSGAVSTSKTKI